jgi:hypothetical protein
MSSVSTLLFLSLVVKNKYNIFFPTEILKIIKVHLNAITIQTIFKLHRPLDSLKIGDRVMIKKNNVLNNRLFGTIININKKTSTIKYLPKLIPNWKRCNIYFWKNYDKLIDNFNFPYYTPKSSKIENNLIIKLNKWNSNTNINSIINENYRIKKVFDIENIIISSHMFKYFF